MGIRVIIGPQSHLLAVQDETFRLQDETAETKDRVTVGVTQQRFVNAQGL